MSAERLRPQDATLWCAQARDAPLQIGALCLFEGAPLRDASGKLRLADLRRHIAVDLERHPRLRTRLVTTACGRGLAWVDDERFDVAHHVRATALPRPGGDAELRDLVSRLLEVPLDPQRPLWEVWVVDGVEGDRVAVVPKVSHVLADGLAVLELAFSVLEVEPHPAVDRAPAWYPPVRPPSAAALLLGEVAARSRSAVDAGAAVVRGVLRPDRMARRTVRLGRAAAASIVRAPRLPVTAPVGPHRDFAWTRLPIDDLLAVRRARDVTLNDVVLAIVAGALRAYLERYDVPTDRRPRVLVPVSTHGLAGEEVENRFSMMLAGLPVDVADPAARLDAVHDEMNRRKASQQATLGPLLFAVADLVPSPVLRRVGPPLLARQPLANLAVTDLPGSRVPLYLLGSRMLELFPFVGVTGNLALIVGALSYADGLGIGVTVDADVVPDADVLVEAIERSARELVDAVGSAGRAGRADAG